MIGAELEPSINYLECFHYFNVNRWDVAVILTQMLQSCALFDPLLSISGILVFKNFEFYFEQLSGTFPPSSLFKENDQFSVLFSWPCLDKVKKVSLLEESVKCT